MAWSYTLNSPANQTIMFWFLIALLVVIGLCLIRALTKNDPVRPPDRDWDDGDRWLGDRHPIHELVHRVPMASRFAPDRDDDADRAAAMAEQIVSDQQEVHATPGRVVHVPAPDEPGYQAPSEIIRVEVGAFVVHMQRGARTQLAEVSAQGVPFPLIPIAEEWDEIVTAMAMEIVRLREGWTVT